MIIRRQQYRSIPRSSRISFGVSFGVFPSSIDCLYSWYLFLYASYSWLITLPQVKHRTGIITFDHLYDFCLFFRAPLPSGFLASFRRGSLTKRLRSCSKKVVFNVLSPVYSTSPRAIAVRTAFA